MCLLHKETVHQRLFNRENRLDTGRASFRLCAFGRVRPTCGGVWCQVYNLRWDSGTDAEYRRKRAALHRAYSPRRMLIKSPCGNLIGAFCSLSRVLGATPGVPPSLEPSIRKKPLPSGTAGVLLREFNCEVSASRSRRLSPEINLPVWRFPTQRKVVFW